MRKIFSIFGMVLVSLALHAMVEKTDWDFSSMSAWDGATATYSAGVVTAEAWRGVGNWGWLEKGEYDKLIVEVAAHDYPILVKIKAFDKGEGDESLMEFQKQLSPSQTSVSFDLTKDIIKWIELDNWSGTNGASFTINRIYACKVIGKEKDIPVWSGSNALGNWSNPLYVDAITQAYAGDELVITYSKESDPQCQVKERNSDGFFSHVGDYLNIDHATQASFLLSESDAAKLRASGLYINGKNMTVTAIELHSHSTLWEGTKAAGNWNEYVEVPSVAVSDLQVGNIICVRVSALTIDGESQVALYDGSWAEFSPGINHVFQEGDEAPMVVEFPVTYKMEQQLRGKNLLVRGKNFTMTDIYVKEGTPVNTVAAYLNVSAAGMATYVLPFNVPELPIGVEAYELTNNGDPTIWATEVNALEADKPVLIVAAAGEYEFRSEDGASDDISGKTGTYTNGALIGTYVGINPIPASAGAVNNYVLQNGANGVGFYQVKEAACRIDPYRAYLSCSYDKANENGGNAAPMRIVFQENAATGMESVQQSEISSQKILRNGQLFILRNGVEYNVNGQMTK